MRNGGLNSPPVTDFFAVPDLDAGSAMSALSMIMDAVMISPTARVFKATEVDVPKSLILCKNLDGKAGSTSTHYFAGFKYLFGDISLCLFSHSHKVSSGMMSPLTSPCNDGAAPEPSQVRYFQWNLIIDPGDYTEMRLKEC